MKKVFRILVIGLIIFTSCSKEGLKSDLDDSREVWLNFKKANNNSYAYTVNVASWTGHSATTTVVVVNGSIAERFYKQYSMDGSEKKLVQEWSEDKNSLNSHQNGAETITLDEIYDKAERVWLKADKDENDLYFEAKNSGMMSLCGYVPKGCQDDCFTGVTISEIVPLVQGRYMAK